MSSELYRRNLRLARALGGQNEEELQGERAGRLHIISRCPHMQG